MKYEFDASSVEERKVKALETIVRRLEMITVILTCIASLLFGAYIGITSGLIFSSL